MVEELTPEQQEVAARTSYAYWAASVSENRPSEQIRIRMAMREARRHLVGEDADYNKALESLRNTCQFREVSIYSFRWCQTTNKR